MDFLHGKTAVVTGAAQGIGKEIACTFAKLGAKVLISDVNEKKLKETAREFLDQGYEVSLYACDVSNQSEAKSLVEYAVQTFGELHVLVNNAGITRDAMLHKMEKSAWEQVMQVNLTGVFYCMQPALLYMRQQQFGRIINISSISREGNIGQANYAATKAGVIGLTKTAAKEVGGFGITCNAICPGFMDTDMTKTIPDKVKEKMVGAIPVGRIGMPQDIANAAAFFASEYASYITGEVLNVSGGLQV
ncbi:3-oxoacyl-ACP reductase FabG [Bacillus pseudomycoides]|uniref:3-oxoacyl-ACP reductase FabG n=1 Tax=Bacillus pseudomycoides TaxID=64104 RepID=A0A2A8H3D4_9BACI|nr:MULTISPECIES: 3-oxoacyl-ACP reductase FabG [Bacillus]AIK38403.1 short chain dehydrogenase family protein [Bacillus pseudomycoides]AJI17614.1 short chain dehydrogenase family protein [Bacillus pseudomycoides]EEM04819.1 3-oxoacyl-(Acyl-carrier-protein) reductase [Bacillus pseudomycoides]EEM10416.1 3-oxoacyl-(Acyl-carrier-protein) reductase [Bacillus pseudomycoides]EEM16142.1 3-oxoacyl-(Acyl-carrier-protein) reductase [Bacillus pseudomycoides DSM 12442]